MSAKLSTALLACCTFRAAHQVTGGEFWARMAVGGCPRLSLHQRGRHCLGIGVSLLGCTGCSRSEAAFMSSHGLCSWAV